MAQDFNIILHNLTEFLNAKSDADIARGLGVTPQALYGFKKKGKFPHELLVNFSFKHKLSLDWLFTGKGPKYSTAGELHAAVAEEATYSKDPFQDSLERLQKTIDLIKSTAAELKLEIQPQKMSHIIEFAFAHRLDAGGIRDLLVLLAWVAEEGK